jgi:DNA-binding MarR family transcriptional regulator
LNEKLEEFFRLYGFDEPRRRVIERLAQGERMTPQELAREIGLDLPTVEDALSRAELAGVVKRRKLPRVSKRGEYVYFLTPPYREEEGCVASGSSTEPL